MPSKTLDMQEAAGKVADLRRGDKKIVFTNGCFDIIHAGHVRYLREARAWGDVLVVGLNSDASVRMIKGEKRPIIAQGFRAEVLGGFWFVDHVVVFDEPDPMNLIKTVAPDVLVKGADWNREKIIGADFVEQSGGRVVRIEMTPGMSTSGIIERIVKICG